MYYARNTGRFLPGVNELWPLMSAGDVWEVYVPSELGYGGVGAPTSWSLHVPDFPVRQSVGPDEALIFKLEMFEISGDKVRFLPSETVSPNRATSLHH
jgi:hypothetical protein|eukprot:SAG25_NODE_4533_length_795_cov_1.245690_2_plen_98_part_00